MPSFKMEQRDSKLEISRTLQKDGKLLKSTTVQGDSIFDKNTRLPTYSEPLQSNRCAGKKPSSETKLHHFQNSSEKNYHNHKRETTQEINARKSSERSLIASERISGNNDTKSKKKSVLLTIGRDAFPGNSSCAIECEKGLDMSRIEHYESSSNKNVQQKKTSEVQEYSKRLSSKSNLSHKGLVENRKYVNRSCSEKLTCSDNHGIAGDRNSLARSQETESKRNALIKNNSYSPGCLSRERSETGGVHCRVPATKYESSKSLSIKDLARTKAKKMKECALMKAKDGKWRESRDLLKDVVEIYKAMEKFGPPYYNPIHLADTYYHLGIALNWMGETRDALDTLDESLRLRRLHGEDDVHVASVLSYIGMIKGNKGDYDGAIYNLRLARLIQRRSNGQDDATTSKLLEDYLRARKSLGNRALAA